MCPFCRYNNNMKNLQRAINYEAIVRALGKSDTYVMPLFEQLKSWCDVNTPLSENLASYGYVCALDDKVLLKAYNEVSESFNRLHDDVVIIEKGEDIFPKDVCDYQFLYLKGKSELLKKKGLSIVGTRLPSERGVARTKETVDTIGPEFVIISGLAKGIDGVAHLQSLKNGFDTIAVIGTNICEYYPIEHRQLQDFIAENGLLVSPFAPCRKTENYFFMNRNRVMSEIACGSLIAESADSGGGVKQAFFSEKQDKPIFIFRESFENPELRWPHEFENPVVIDDAQDLIPYLKGEKQTPMLQPNLF